MVDSRNGVLYQTTFEQSVTAEYLKKHHEVIYQYNWHTGATGLPAVVMPQLDEITPDWGWHFENSRLILSFSDPESYAQAKLEIDVSDWSM